MADVRELSVALTLQDNFSGNMRAINQQLKEADKALQQASASTSGYSSKTQQLQAVTEMLQKKMALQKAAVEQCRQALDKAKATYEANIQKQKELQKQLEENKAKFGENSEEVKRTEQQLQAMDKAVQSAGNRVANATNALNTAQNALSQTEQQLSRNTDKWTHLAAKLDDVAAKSKLVSQDLQKVGSAVSIASAAVVGIGTAAVNTFATYDDSLKTVQATMGLVAGSSAEADAAIALLDSTAQAMGVSTRYSASEAASALNYLALAGYDAEKACDALPTVLQLAQAGGMDLAYASDLATDAMAALGLQTSQLGGFVDSMAVTAQKSNTSVSQLGEAILTIGGTAKIMAGGTTELNTALGVLANRGIKGSEGGTALRNILLSLSAPTTKARNALDELGISITDSEGNMRSLDAIISDLSASMQGMGAVQQEANLKKIFNKNDLAAVQALMAGVGEEWNSLMANISNSAGAAEQMADTMESGIGGQLRSMKSAVEGLAISLGEGLAPIVGEAVEFITNLTRGLSEMDDATKSNVIRIGLIVAAAGPAILIASKVASGISGVATAISGVIKAAQAAGTIKAALAGLVTSPHFIAFLAIAGVIAGVVIAINSLTKATEESTQTAEEAAEAYAEMSEEFDDAMDSFNQSQNVIATAQEYKQLQSELAGTASAATDAADKISRLSAQKTDIKVKIVGDPQRDVTAPDDLATGVTDGTSTVELDPTVGRKKASPGDFIEGDTDVELRPQVDDGDKKTATDFVSDGGVLHMSVEVPEEKRPATDFAVDKLTLQPVAPSADDKLAATALMTGTTVDVTGRPVGEIDPDSYIATEANVPGKTGNTIEAGAFLEPGSTAEVTGKKGNTINAGDFLRDGTAAEIPGVAITIKPDKFVGDGSASIPGEAEAIDPQNFVEQGKATITGEAETIKPQQFVGEGDAVISGEAGTPINPDNFVGPGNASISGEPGEMISPDKFVDTGSAQIPGDPETIVPQEFVGEGAARVTGEPENKIEQSAFVGTDAAKISVKVEPESLTLAKAELATLGQTITEYENKAETLNKQLQTAQADLQRKETLYKRLSAGADKTRLEGEIAALKGEIDSLETQISANQSRLDTAKAAYSDASEAAETLAGKQQRLIELARQLAGDTDGSIIKTYAQAEAYLAEAEAAEAAANAAREVALAQMESSLSGMASGYTSASANRKSASTERAGYIATRDSYYTGEALNYDAVYQAAYAYKLNKEWADYTRKYPTVSYNDYIADATRVQFTGTAAQVAIVDDYIQNLNDNIVRVDTAEREARETQDDYISRLISYYDAKRESNEDYSWDDLAETVGMWFAGEEEGAATAAAVVAAAKAQVEAREASRQNEQITANVQYQLDSITDRVKALTEAYNEAYDAAYKSMSGQFKLFEKASVSSDAAGVKVSDMISNLGSQVDYMKTYAANLETLKEKGLNADLLSELSDGSAESAAYVATLAGADADQINQLNEAYAEVEAARKDYADTVASIETDFETTMAEIQSDLQETIEQMNMSEDAAAAADATIQAYADAATSEDNLEKVRAAYQGLADTAAIALGARALQAAQESAVETEAAMEEAASGAVESAATAGSEAAEALVESANEGENIIETDVVTDQTGEELAKDVVDAAQEYVNQHPVSVAFSSGAKNSSGKFTYLAEHANGGRTTQAAIFGEAGPEWAIPEEHSARTASLIDAVRRASGFSWAELVGNAARQSSGSNLISSTSNRTYNASANLNVGTLNVNETMDADALFDTMAARNRATIRGYGN